MQSQYSRLPQRAAATPMPSMGGYGASTTPGQFMGYGREAAQSQRPAGLAQLYQTQEQRQQSVYNAIGRPQTGFERFLDDQQFDFMGRREQLLNEARAT